MRKRLFCFLFMTSVILGAVSCYKDLSTVADHDIPDIIIAGVDSVLHVAYGEEIAMDAQISQEGRSPSDLSCEWVIDITPNNGGTRIEIGDTPSLRYRVANSPSDKPYILRLNVTDHQTGLVKAAVCKLYVSSSLGEGLLVAHTRDGGKTTEFDLLANPYVTYGYTSAEPRYTRDIYALANDCAFEGRVNAILEMVDSDGAALNENRILIGTSDHFIALDPLTFVPNTYDAALFYSASVTDFNTTALFNFGGYSTGAIIGGQAYGMLTHIDRQYSLLSISVTPNDFFRPGNIAYGPMQQGGHLAVFDETRGKFFFIMGWNLTQSAFSEVNASFDFPLSGNVCIGGGCSRNQQLAFLLKDPSGAYRVCLLDVQNLTHSATTFAVDGAEMDDIVSVAFCDNCDLMYYTTDRSVYVTLLSPGRVVTRKVNWSPDSPGEKITRIRQYTQGWYGTHQYYMNDYPFQLETNRLQLMITTYDETTGEGRIYLRPFNVSTGLFTAKDNGTYGGFGEITAMCPTFK